MATKSKAVMLRLRPEAGRMIEAYKRDLAREHGIEVDSISDARAVAAALESEFVRHGIDIEGGLMRQWGGSYRTRTVDNRTRPTKTEA